MKFTFYILSLFLLLNSSCSSQSKNSNSQNNNVEKININDTIDYLNQIEFDSSSYQLIKKGEKPQKEIILKNKNNCQISFSGEVPCSDSNLFRFQGIVKDNNGNPIENVKIEFFNQKTKTNYTTYSDSTGKYSINALIDKSYTFKVNSKGYYSFVMINFAPLCDEIRDVNISLQKL